MDMSSLSSDSDDDDAAAKLEFMEVVLPCRLGAAVLC